MKPTTPAQIEATIADVRTLLDGDPLDAVSLYRGHLAIVLGALDEARLSDDALTRIALEDVNAGQVSTIADLRRRLDQAERERDEARRALTVERDRTRVVACECGEADACALVRERDEARAALASEPARIAAAEMARDVAWVRACDVNDGTANIRRGLGLRDKHKAWTIVLLAQGTGSTATDADIAAAIRAAREVKP